MSDPADDAIRHIQHVIADIHRRLDLIDAIRAHHLRGKAIAAAEAEMRASADALAVHPGDETEWAGAWKHVRDARGVATAAGVIIASDTRH